MMRTSVIAWIGVGANLDDPASAVRNAMDALGALPDCRLVARSSLYRTAPVGAGVEGQPDYINAVAGLETSLTAWQLLQALFGIEQHFGRQRSYRNAPRTLDLDLLLYGNETINQEGLHVPHPRMHERAFVLLPLSEASPGQQIPGRGRVEDLLPMLEDQSIERTV